MRIHKLRKPRQGRAGGGEDRRGKNSARARGLRLGHLVGASFDMMLADPGSNTFLQWAMRRREAWKHANEAILQEIAESHG